MKSVSDRHNSQISTQIRDKEKLSCLFYFIFFWSEILLFNHKLRMVTDSLQTLQNHEISEDVTLAN